MSLTESNDPFNPSKEKGKEDDSLYESKSFQRKIKTQIKAKQQVIKVIVPPQWRYLCAREISDLGYTVENLDDGEKGGNQSFLEVKGKIIDAYRLCLHLRTASRVCIRIARFKATALDKMIRKLGSIAWHLWLNPFVPLRIYSNVEYSKIRHEGLVEETLARVVKDHFLQLDFPDAPATQPSTEQEKQRIWIEGVRDWWNITIDITGAHLHQRGYRREPSEAPMRETLGAAIVKTSGWNGKVPFFDAMTGSGTLAIEAAMMALNIPPGLKRSFLFEKLPFHQRSAWLYEKTSAEKGISPELLQPIIALEKRGKNLDTAKRNGQRAGVGNHIIWMRDDFFNITQDCLPLQLKGYIAINPPYGKRLSSDGIGLYRRIKDHLKKYYRGWKVLIVSPHERAGKQFQEFKPDKFRFPHGGLWVELLVFSVP